MWRVHGLAETQVALPAGSLRPAEGGIRTHHTRTGASGMRGRVSVERKKEETGTASCLRVCI